MRTRLRLPRVVAQVPTTTTTTDASGPALVAIGGWVEGSGTSGGSRWRLLPRGTWGMRE